MNYDFVLNILCAGYTSLNFLPFGLLEFDKNRYEYQYFRPKQTVRISWIFALPVSQWRRKHKMTILITGDTYVCTVINFVPLVGLIMFKWNKMPVLGPFLYLHQLDEKNIFVCCRFRQSIFYPINNKKHLLTLWWWNLLHLFGFS